MTEEVKLKVVCDIVTGGNALLWAVIIEPGFGGLVLVLQSWMSQTEIPEFLAATCANMERCNLQERTLQMCGWG